MRTGDDEEEVIKEQKEEMTEEEIRIEEVIEVIRVLKRGKPEGHGNIPAEMLQNMGKNGLSLLTVLFNKI